MSEPQFLLGKTLYISAQQCRLAEVISKCLPRVKAIAYFIHLVHCNHEKMSKRSSACLYILIRCSTRYAEIPDRIVKEL